MRLLNCETMELEEFFHRRHADGGPASWSRDRLDPRHEQYIPQYYILSHCWGADEVSYKDFIKGRKKDGAGYKKIAEYCRFALNRHAALQLRYRINDKQYKIRKNCYVWVDTCCIDKRSSAELSEAINSMWTYYSKAEECHVYLADVGAINDTIIPAQNLGLDASKNDLSRRATCIGVEPPRCSIDGYTPSAALNIATKAQLRASRWFLRGWTLQELLAPEVVIFLFNDWVPLGCHYKYREPRALKFRAARFKADQTSLCITKEVHKITGIEVAFLTDDKPISTASIAKRMSWASRRSTTRIEDEAYCLLGLLNVNMPLLYGEGRKAFERLQETVMSQAIDQSLFVHSGYGILAESSCEFEGSSDVEKTRGYTWPFSRTNLGIEFRARVYKVSLTDSRKTRLSLPDALTKGSRNLFSKINIRLASSAWSTWGDSVSEAKLVRSIEDELWSTYKDLEIIQLPLRVSGDILWQGNAVERDSMSFFLYTRSREPPKVYFKFSPPVIYYLLRHSCSLSLEHSRFAEAEPTTIYVSCQRPKLEMLDDLIDQRLSMVNPWASEDEVSRAQSKTPRTPPQQPDP